ncbi:hypothetical protein SAMD00019534_043280 [Acytostelium subglobosum LB1]|uniref:hypothetical protein n=1 Tax=Acytostelium subglobosum LB1 TaxID=1410327 RepID=UPI0006448DD0|nr:hypothetical protein SAMD00019534_043280 [Acytostelium subglobosum LB1]GAM21153.1 hypothetical protein SAMD00019534_043280 [Acytostelium subglobosum LB1]|eukprot:XP_012756287.1 hypothetical protein SAMD00019534_043280 [Acytostelium subglobosum LB1]
MFLQLHPIISILSYITIGWLIFFTFLKILQITYGQVLLDFLNSISVHIQLFSLNWSTTQLNAPLKRLSTRFDRFWHHWYRVGNTIVILLVPLALLSLIYNLFILLSQRSTNNAIITPIVPGVNFPTSHLAYLILSFIFSAIIHEAGHAICFLNLNRRINEVGIHMFFIFPSAYVNINAEDLKRIAHGMKLRVFTAGVWHNIVLSLVIYLLMPLTPYALMPLYHYSTKELYINNIPKESLLHGSVKVGDRVLAVGDCTVTDANSYFQCIDITWNQPNSYCLPIGFKDCVDTTQNIRACIEHEQLFHMKPCANSSTCGAMDKKCTSLAPSRMFNLILESHGNDYKGKEELPFIGTAQELWDSFSTSHYRARWSWIQSVDLHYFFMTLQNFIIAVSLGLAMLNMLPIGGLDGHFIMTSLLHLAVTHHYPAMPVERQEALRDSIYSHISLGSTILLGVNLLISFYFIIAK